MEARVAWSSGVVLCRWAQELDWGGKIGKHFAEVEFHFIFFLFGAVKIVKGSSES